MIRNHTTAALLLTITIWSLICLLFSAEAFAEEAVSAAIADDNTEFCIRVSEISQDSDSASDEGLSSDQGSASCRLLVVCSEAPDISGFRGVTDAVYNGEDLYIMQFDSDASAEAAYKVLRSRKEVISVEYDRVFPALKNEFSGGIEKKAPSAHYTWGADYMGFDDYIDRLDNDALQDIVVAVIDSGIQKSHKAFSGRTVAGYDFVNADPDPNDSDGHGTHVAGIIADCTKSSDRVLIMPLKVLDRKGETTISQLGNAILYAADSQASVINISIGGTHSSYLDYIIEKAAKKEKSLVIAAGNESVDIDRGRVCPAHVACAITVGAVDRDSSVSYFSNFGSKLDAVAPGTDITSAYPWNTYVSLDGTSMAAPHVSACIAIMLCRYGALDLDQVTSLVCRTCTPHENTRKYGHGIVDLHNMISDISGTEISVNSHGYVYTGKPVKISPSVTQNGEALFKNTDYTLSYSNNQNVGTAEVTITGNGTYAGSVTKKFKIIPKGTSIKNVKSLRRGFSVSWKSQKAKMSKSRVTGYQIQYSAGRSFKNAKTVKVKKASTVSKKITKLKPGQKYYVRVRTYKTVKGVNYYSRWSKKRSVKTQ